MDGTPIDDSMRMFYDLGTLRLFLFSRIGYGMYASSPKSPWVVLLAVRGGRSLSLVLHLKERDCVRGSVEITKLYIVTFMLLLDALLFRYDSRWLVRPPREIFSPGFSF